MVKLACMTLPYMSFSFERALQGIARSGYRYVAFGLQHEGMEVPDEQDPQALIVVRRLFEQYDLEPVMLIGNQQFAPGQPIERAKQRLLAAKELGIKEVISVGTQGYRSFPDVPFTEEEMEPSSRIFAEHFQKIAAEAEALDMTITIKPHTGNTATAVHLVRTLARIGSPNVKASYDPGNVQFYEGVNAGTDFPKISGQTYSLLAKDHRGAQANVDFPVPGTGDVNFPDIFACMKLNGFDGSVVVERVDGPDEADLIDERMLEARIQLERLLQEAGFDEVL